MHSFGVELKSVVDNSIVIAALRGIRCILPNLKTCNWFVMLRWCFLPQLLWALFITFFFLAGLNRRIKEVLHKVSLVCCLFTHMEVKTTWKSEMEKKIPLKDMHLNRICNLCKIFWMKVAGHEIKKTKPAWIALWAVPQYLPCSFLLMGYLVFILNWF